MNIKVQKMNKPYLLKWVHDSDMLQVFNVVIERHFSSYVGHAGSASFF